MGSIGNLSTLGMLRFVAAFGIVWGHVMAQHPSRDVFYFSITIFLALTFYLTPSTRPSSGDGRTYNKYRRYFRLLLPWLFWCAVFKVVYAYQHRDIVALFSVTDPYSLLIGPSIHLWYLPFTVIGLWLLSHLSASVSTRESVIWASIGLAAISAVAYWLHDLHVLPDPFSQWAGSTGAALFGFLIGRSRPLGASIVPLALFTGLASLYWIFGDGGWPPYVLVGILVFFAAINFKSSIPYAKKLGVISFGIYLIHPLVMWVWFRLLPSTSGEVSGAIAVFVLSALATLALRKIPIMRAVI